MLLLLAEITPKPVLYKKGTTLYEVANLTYSCKTPLGVNCSSMVKPVFDAYYSAIFPKSVPTPDDQKSAIKTVSVVLRSDTYATEISKVDEYYEITVDASEISIMCSTPDGIARAFATLAQLIEAKPGQTYTRGKYAIYDCHVQDQAEFRFRQLLVDSSRHFLPLSTLKRQVLGLSFAKLNCLHLHIIDSQSNSFAAETKPADNMQKAAYVTGKRYLLTKQDITELAKYARPLGVFIMVEYDMPGHAASWSKADPSIIANCPNSGSESINPLNELTYQYIEAYVKDVFETATISGAIPIIHLGGDEVNHNCWNEDPVIRAYMVSRDISTVTLWQEFHNRVADMILALQPKAFIQYWQESYENGNKMAPNAIVNFWTNVNQIGDCTSKGIFAVRTYGWYLDVLQPASSHYLYQDSWQDMYKVNPYQNVVAEYKSFVLGGGACIWGEYTDDGNIDDFIWPRAIATAEVLWSLPADRTITADLTSRLNDFSCKMKQVGVRGGPIAAGAPCPGVDYPNEKYAK